jgi:hypothetical protein
LALTTSTSSENISMGGYTNLSIGASTNCLYTGTITTNSTNAYHLGGGGAKLTLSSASNLTGAKSVLIGGKVAFSGRKDYAGSTIFNINSPDRVLTLNSNASIPNCTGISLNSGTLFQNSTTPLACPIMLSTSSGTLGGTGTYNTTIDMRTSGGHLSPGSAGLGTIGTMTIGSAGDLHLGENSVLDFDFSATTPGVGDRIVLAGAGHSTTLDGTLNITCSSDRVPTGGYTVISNIDPALMINNGIDLGIVPAGHNWGVYFASHNGLYDLVITAAPEPGTIVLLATGLLGLLAYAWRKRRNQK